MKRIDWVNVLHFYQPSFQDEDVVKRITKECYLPVTRLLMNRFLAKAVINIHGCLLDMLNHFSEGKEVIVNLKTLSSLGQIDITGTGKYNPVFPFISQKEIKRQLKLQEEALQYYFDLHEIPDIVFIPELAYLPGQERIIKENGYDWMIIDETSLREKKSLMGKYILKGKEMKLLVRDRKISEALDNAISGKNDIKGPEQFVYESLKKKCDKGFVVTVTNVESFSYQTRNRFTLLKEIYAHPSVNSILIKDVSRDYEVVDVDTIPSSWLTGKTDMSKKIHYPLWFHPENHLHRLLWQFFDIALEEVREHGTESQNKILDVLMDSSPFFWSSCRPWWNGAIAEMTSDNLLVLMSELTGTSERLFSLSQSLRAQIYEEVSALNKSGKAKAMQEQFLANIK